MSGLPKMRGASPLAGHEQSTFAGQAVGELIGQRGGVGPQFDACEVAVMEADLSRAVGSENVGVKVDGLWRRAGALPDAVDAACERVGAGDVAGHGDSVHFLVVDAAVYEVGVA